MRLIGYVRGARVAGREGPSFISPEDERRRIEQVAGAGGHVVVDWQTDLDKPGRPGKGRKGSSRPGFEAALQAVERGDADGVAVAKLDRFARSVAGATSALERLETAGGALVAADLGMDMETPSGRLMRNVLVALAGVRTRPHHGELASCDSGRATRTRRLYRGAPPTGYLKTKDGRLEPNPETAPVVIDVFRRRAAARRGLISRAS